MEGVKASFLIISFFRIFKPHQWKKLVLDLFFIISSEGNIFEGGIKGVNWTQSMVVDFRHTQALSISDETSMTEYKK